MLSFFAACSPPNALSPTTAPDAAALQNTLTKDYAHPVLHVLSTGESLHDDVVNWTRTYDGATLLVDTKSVWTNGAWEHRFHRELTEPAAVRKDEVISNELAAQTAGLIEQLQNGLAAAQLVYLPEWSQAPEKIVQRAEDVELVVKGWRLAIQIDNAEDDSTSEVDAYTNTLISQHSNKSSVLVNAQGAFYPQVPLDMNGRCSPGIPGHPGTCSYTYQDPVRVSTKACEGTGCLNAAGQGVTNDTSFSVWPATPVYAPYTAGDPRADVAFALREAWDFYSDTYQRRGLHNLQPADGWQVNDAVVFFPTTSGYNIQMDAYIGYIEIRANPNWPNLARLDVLGHEWTHAVFEYDANWPASYWGVTGGIDEAYADFFGEMIEAYGNVARGAASDFNVPASDWVVDEGTFRLRNICDPEEATGLEEQPSNMVWSASMEDPSVGMEPHLAMGPFDRAFCMLSQGMLPNGSPTNPERQSTLVPAGFDGMTSLAVGRLAYYAMPALYGVAKPLTAMTLRNLFLQQQATSDYAFSPWYKDIQDAFAAVLIGPAADRAKPSVSLGNTHINAGNPFTAYATPNANGTAIQSVEFMLDGSYAVIDNAAPYEFTPEVTGTHTLDVIATDIHQNQADTGPLTVYIDTAPQIFLADATPCTTGQWCPSYQGKRLIHIGAGDSDGIKNVTVFINGVEAMNLPQFQQPPQVFDEEQTLTFTQQGTNVITATATDIYGNTSPPVTLSVNIDIWPPAVWSISFSGDKTTYGKGYINFCATDPSGVAGWDFTVDGTPVGITTSQAFTNGCGQFTFNTTPGVPHIGTLHTFDEWDNSSYTPINFTMPALPPVLNTPTIAIDSSDFGHVVLTAVYATATPADPIAQVSFAMCNSTGSCQWGIWQASSSPLDQTTHSDGFLNLTAGVTYYGQVTVLTAHGGVATKNSVEFQLTQGSTQIYNEVEVNDFTGNTPPAGTTQVRGTYDGKIYGGFQGYWDEDLFNFYAPTGTFAIHSNFNCSNVSFSIYASDDGENWALDVDPVLANGNITLSDTGFEWYQVAVNYTANAISWSSPTAAGCANPQYSFDITSR